MVNLLRYSTGAILASLFPEKTRRETRHFTIEPEKAPGRGRLDRLIRYYVGQRARNTPAALEALHKDFWANQRRGDWFDDSINRHNNSHVPLFGPFAAGVRTQIEAAGIRQVFELGTGSGLWLNHLSSLWPSVERFTGIDLSADQIAASAERFPKLRFIAADLVAWTAEFAEPNSVYVSHCGVLEYLSEASLRQLLDNLKTRAPGSLLLFVEPVDHSMNLDTDFASVPHGLELSFSHNHPFQLRRAGMQVLRSQEIEMSGFRMLAILAQVPQHSKGMPLS